MDETSVTRVYLEGLSTGELLKLADRFGIDIPFGLERVFIIEALLETGFGGADEMETRDDIHSNFLEAAALPRQYNISFIEVIIRDPLWAFVFWELKSYDREILEKAPDFDGYCLRVIPSTVSPAEGQGKTGGASFIVPVDSADTARYLGFPPMEGRYRVELCARKEAACVPLISSQPFRLPWLLEIQAERTGLSQDFRDACDNPLIRLSGVRDFSIIRSVERQSREHGAVLV